MHAIEITIKAHKQIGGMHKADQGKIYKAIETLKAWPDCRNVKKLKNREEYRLRIGNYRILFMTAPEKITVKEVKKRDERTY
ncbi:MAG: type II toxin-antitoxin system RelE/ParE family toxin [Thermodesulfobacteriota bacterium]|nr:type II toxin-antitoxin system RelE/ParE family toxin [Thermodesulfobacteriota bacterium]